MKCSASFQKLRLHTLLRLILYAPLLILKPFTDARNCSVLVAQLKTLLCTERLLSKEPTEILCYKEGIKLVPGVKKQDQKKPPCLTVVDLHSNIILNLVATILPSLSVSQIV